MAFFAMVVRSAGFTGEACCSKRFGKVVYSVRLVMGRDTVTLAAAIPNTSAHSFVSPPR